MNDKREENLKALLAKFLNSEQAEQAAEDIQKGEEILRNHTAPEPTEELITNIKAEITGSLPYKKEVAFRKALYKTMAVAAGFILFAVISVKFFERGINKGEKTAISSVMPKAVWESECLADDSDDSAILVAEIGQIESDLLALQLGENGDEGYEAVSELEMKLIETNGDFWKG